MMCFIKMLMVILLSTLGILISVSSSWARVFDNESVCNGAVILNELNIKIWTTDDKFVEYVKEAKRRGLNCGVKDFKSSLQEFIWCTKDRVFNESSMNLPYWLKNTNSCKSFAHKEISEIKIIKHIKKILR